MGYHLKRLHFMHFSRFRATMRLVNRTGAIVLVIKIG